MPQMSQVLQRAHAPASEVRGERHQLRALTGLRIVAALAVVFYHYVAAFIAWNPLTGLPKIEKVPAAWWGRLAASGPLGVDCFFVLSGFILAYTYVTPSSTLRGTRSAFWVARVARIYPVYLVGMVLGIVPFLWHERHLAGLAGNALAQPLLLQAWVPSLTTWNALNPPGWSLSVEAFCYLLFPFILAALALRPRRTLRVVAALSCVVFAAIPAVLLPLSQLTHQPFIIWATGGALYFDPLVRLPEFILGVSLGLLFARRHEQRRARVTSISPTSDGRVDIALAALALAVIGIAFLPLPGSYPMQPLVAPLMAAGVALLAWERGRIAGVLSTRVCVWLGDISYGVYILHLPIWAWLAWLAQRGFALPPSSPVLLPIYLLCVVGAAGLSHRYIETPARVAIRAWWTARETRRAAHKDTATATSPARVLQR